MGAISEYQIDRLPRELRALADVAQSLIASTELPNILDAVIVKIADVLEPVTAGSILLLDTHSGLLRPRATHGYNQEIFGALSLQIDESFPGHVFNTGKARLCSTREEVAQAMQDMQPANQIIWKRSLDENRLASSTLAVPIATSDQNFGVLILERHDKQLPFSQQNIALTRLMADIIAISVKRSYSDLKSKVNPVDRRIELLQTELVETLSHQLRMPLTAIKGYATALLLEEVDWSLAKRQEFLQLIEDECDQMETLLADLLDSILIDVNQFALEIKPFHLQQAAREIAGEMERRTEKHHVIVDFPDDFPIVHVDPRWIKQVFRNLIDNAIKYSPDGGLIVIRGETRPSDVVINISDQGIGISPEELIPLFEKYMRAKSLAEVQIPGTGLGLPIARSIIEAHRGHIWAKSNVGEGTTLSFSLPYTL